jgi:preprotein translocase subunit SecF
MKLNITSKRNLWWAISGIAMIASVIAMIMSFYILHAPIRPGLDFVGGTKIQIARDCTVAENCAQPIDTIQVQEVLEAQNLGNSTIQLLGDDKQILSVRTENLDSDRRSELLSSLGQAIGKFDDQTVQIDSVGPTVGEELFVSGILALLVSYFGIIVYLSIRFQFDYALFAIAALFHDVLVTCGVFAVLGLVMGVEVDSLFLVSLLTIIGFSVNDTVVIYDRIRENMIAEPNGEINEIVDNAVNQTLARSINTTLTTLLPLVAIFLFGGQTLKFFALALIVGFTLGAYSSIFVASTLLAWWRNKQKKNSVVIADTTASE